MYAYLSIFLKKSFLLISGKNSFGLRFFLYPPCFLMFAMAIIYDNSYSKRICFVTMQENHLSQRRNLLSQIRKRKETETLAPSR